MKQVIPIISWQVSKHGMLFCGIFHTLAEGDLRHSTTFCLHVQIQATSLPKVHLRLLRKFSYRMYFCPVKVSLFTVLYFIPF